MKRSLQVAVLALLALVAGVAGWRAAQRVREFRRSEAVCAAVDARDWRQALALSIGTTAPTVAGRRMTECRCLALLHSGRRGDCVASLQAALADVRNDTWLPSPYLTTVLVAARREHGDLTGAAQLAQRGADRYPRSVPMQLLAGLLRLDVEQPRPVLDDVIARLRGASGAEGDRARALLAGRAIDAGEFERALRLLGDHPLQGDGADGWYMMRALALAESGHLDELVRTTDRWQRETRHPAMPEAEYAFVLSVTQQPDPRGRTSLDLLQQAVAAADGIGDADLAKRVYIRYVGTLAVYGQTALALRTYDEGVVRLGDLGFLDRNELLRGGRERGGAQRVARTAIELRVGNPEPGDRLLVSPDASLPVDTAFEDHALPASGRLLVERSPDSYPMRWVLRDATGAVRGSGAAWPPQQGIAAVAVERRPATAIVATPSLAQRPASGRRRVFVVILDCGDWRFVQHGRARGELPTFAALADRGMRAVLSSVPPFTAVAVRSIAQPGARGVDGVLGVIHQLGAEIGGLNFVGSNPAAAIAWVLPGSADLFRTLGAGDLRTANLLHSYGGMQLGRHGEITGPHGATSEEPLAASRALSADEAILFGPIDENRRRLVENMAADFDNVARLARPGGPDLLLLRVASLDLLTHGNFAETAAAAQDDGRPFLFHVYRYIDRRLAELWRTLDTDDLLIVMSDHGAHTALQHDRRAMFFAIGKEVPAGRVPGEPELRGIPRLLAALFGVATPWPATGIEHWAAEMPARRTGRVTLATAR